MDPATTNSSLSLETIIDQTWRDKDKFWDNCFCLTVYVKLTKTDGGKIARKGSNSSTCSIKAWPRTMLSEAHFRVRSTFIRCTTDISPRLTWLHSGARTSQTFFRFRISHNYATRIVCSMVETWKAGCVELVLWHYINHTVTLCRISKINSIKGYCLWQNITIKITQQYHTQLFMRHDKEQCSIAFVLGLWPGFREEIPDSDTLHLIIDVSDYLFSSSPLSSVCLVWFLSLEKKGQHYRA